MRVEVIDIQALAAAMATVCGRSVRCSPLEGSSTGRAFLAKLPNNLWVVKVFPFEDIRVPRRAIDVLGALAKRPIPTPESTFESPLGLGPFCGYSYRHVEGRALRDHTLTLQTWFMLGSMLRELYDHMRAVWDHGDLDPELYERYDLEGALKKSIGRLRGSHPRVAAAASRMVAEAEQVGARLTPIHRDLHPGNVIKSAAGLVPVDFDGIRLGTLENAVAPMISKVCDLEIASAGVHARINAVVAAASRGFGGLSTTDLLLSVLEKKLSEVWYLDQSLLNRGKLSEVCRQFKRETLRGVAWLFREGHRMGSL